MVQQIKQLNDSIACLEAKLSDYKAKEIPVQAISKELFAQYPEITSLSLTRGASVAANDADPSDKVVAIITSEQPVDSTLHNRIERWLKVRLNDENVTVISAN